VKEIGSKRGRRATWIGAYGDQTFMKLDESLVTDEQFEQSTILASNDYFGNMELSDSFVLSTFVE